MRSGILCVELLRVAAGRGTVSRAGRVTADRTDDLVVGCAAPFKVLIFVFMLTGDVIFASIGTFRACLWNGADALPEHVLSTVLFFDSCSSRLTVSAGEVVLIAGLIVLLGVGLDSPCVFSAFRCSAFSFTNNSSLLLSQIFSPLPTATISTDLPILSRALNLFSMPPATPDVLFAEFPRA